MTDRPTRRSVAAAATRAEILRAARLLFVTNGYGQTSIAEVAAEAGVAVQTIYSSIGPKSTLLLAFNDFIDDESGLLPLVEDAFAAPTGRELLGRVTNYSRLLAERCGDLIDTIYTASDTEPEAAAVIAEGRRRHAASCSGFAARLDELGTLAPGMKIDDAALVLATATQWTVWADLVRGGWTYDQAEDWIADSLVTLLLETGPAESRPKRSRPRT